MKAFLAVIVALAVCGTIRADDEPKPESKTVSFADATEAPAEGGSVAASGRRVLGDREARKFGVSLKSVLAAHKELKASGVIDGTEGSSERAVLIYESIATKTENKSAYAKINIDTIEKIMALIEKIIAFLERFNLI